MRLTKLRCGDSVGSVSTMTRLRTVARWALGVFLVFAGVSHLGPSRQEFRAQVPPWLPLDPDLVVLASGVVEIALGLAVLLVVRRRAAVGWVVAAFLVAVFPGNIAQWAERRDAFGLDTDTARLGRLAFQPLLIAWALWCTGAWRARHPGERGDQPTS